MGNLLKSSAILAMITFVSALALSHIKKVTYPSILKQAKEKQERAVSLVLPGFTVGKKMTVKVDGKDFIYWAGEKTVEVELKKEIKKGYAYLTELPGYSGGILSMVGIEENGTILGISILKQTETPGLGARCEEIASTETFFGFIGGLFSGKSSNVKEVTTPWFQEQFRDLDLNKKINVLKLGDWKPELKQDLMERHAISAMTGATVTSTTVTRSLEQGYIRLKKVIDKEKEDKQKTEGPR